MPMMTKICKRCGEEFQTERKARKYCLACSPKVAQQQTREWRELQNPDPSKRLAAKDAEMNRILRLAAEAGQSYGEYVSKHEI